MHSAGVTWLCHGVGAVAGCQGGGSPGRPWLRGTDASSTVFGAGAQDPGIETVYGAKLAAAQYPCDLRPKAFSWSPKWASQLQPKSWPLSVEPGMFLPRPVSLPTTSSPALGRHSQFAQNRGHISALTPSVTPCHQDRSHVVTNLLSDLKLERSKIMLWSCSAP